MNLQSASYTPNLLNQYTQRTVPGAVPVLGLAEAASTVTVNSGSTYRHGEYFWKELSAANTTVPVWQSVSVQAVHGANNNTVSGNVFVPQTPETYSYDLDGNLTGDGRWTYSWDAENRLVRLVAATAVGPQQRIDFEYDAGSRRIRKKVWNNTSGTGTPATDIKFLYQGWNLIAELNALSSDAVIRSFVWGNDLSGTFQGAGGVGGLLAVKSSGVCHFTAYDGNGNVIALINGSTGTPSAQYEYGPFGEMIRATGTMAESNPFRFSTKYQDEESGLLYYGYRYYNASTGRWLSRDPLADEGPNNYYFIFNNPENAVDVNGEWQFGFYQVGQSLMNLVAQPVQSAGRAGASWLKSYIVSWNRYARRKFSGTFQVRNSFPLAGAAKFVLGVTTTVSADCKCVTVNSGAFAQVQVKFPLPPPFPLGTSVVGAFSGGSDGVYYKYCADTGKSTMSGRFYLGANLGLRFGATLPSPVSSLKFEAFVEGGFYAQYEYKYPNGPDGKNFGGYLRYDLDVIAGSFSRRYEGRFTYGTGIPGSF